MTKDNMTDKMKQHKQGGNADADKGKIHSEHQENQSTSSIMDATLFRVGMRVRCRICPAEGRVKPQTDYEGWYKSKLLRKSNRWFCPGEHYKIGRDMDNRFYDNHMTPDPWTEEEKKAQEHAKSAEEELYELLD